MYNQFVVRFPFSIRMSQLTSNTGTLLFFSFFACLFTRGFFQLFVPSGLTMVIQVLSVGMITSVLLFLYPKNFYFREGGFFLIVSLFFATGSLGAFLTGLIKEFHYWGIYLVFNSILMCLYFSFIHLARFHSPNIPFQKILLFWGWILFFVGLCEQLRLFLMPGSDPFSVIVRPSSLLGSMLHYPLVISVIAFCLLQWGVEKKKKNYFLSGLFFCFIPFTTLSRSGVLVVLLSLIFYLSMRSWLSYRRLFKYTIYVVCGVGFFFCLALSLNNESVLGSLFNRVLFASTIESGGNSERVLAWSRGVNLWLDTNLLFGEYTGMVTRASGSVFRDVKFRGVESGALQLLLNFGFLGVLFFYSLFIFLYRRIHKEHYFLKAVFIAGLIQGLFHASIEVFSYMVCLGILPFISQTYKRC